MRYSIGNANAGGILAAIALEATLRLNMLMHKPNDVQYWMAWHLQLWPVVHSAYPTLRTVHPNNGDSGSWAGLVGVDWSASVSCWPCFVEAVARKGPSFSSFHGRRATSKPCIQVTSAIWSG